MGIRCITFDLDDTLWDIGSVIAAAEQRFYDWLQHNCPVITTGYTPQDLVEHRHDFFAGFPDQRHDLTGLRKRWLEHLFQVHGIDTRLAEAAFRVFWEHRNAVTLYDDAQAMLEQLKPRYRMGVITNGNACVEFIGIGHYFDFVVSSERAGRSKPEPEIFQLALSDSGIDAHEVAHVGDDPTNDIAGAARMGMRTVWYNPRNRPWPVDLHAHLTPDVTIRALADLGDALSGFEVD